MNETGIHMGTSFFYSNLHYLHNTMLESFKRKEG